jgi:hypothetical protein
MSTRCQVQVIQEGLKDWNFTISLYHHWDGYPTNILPLIAKAFQSIPDEDIWLAGRAGHAAAFIIASDLAQFEPEASLDLHSDIEWLYVVHCVNSSGGTIAEKPVWYVKVYAPIKGFWDHPDMDHMKLVGDDQISKLVKIAERIEAAI